MPSFRGSSWPRDRTHIFYVSCTGRQVFFFFNHQCHLGKVKGERHSVVSKSLLPHGLYSPRNSPGHSGLEWVGFPFSGDLHNPGIKPRSSTLQVDSLPAEPQGKPQNTGVGSLSLLQWIFPTWELNQGLLHCRWILYQLSCRGSQLGSPF